MTMKTLRVQYTVRPEYAEQNKRNVAAVMAELRASGRGDIKYATYLHEDGKTFMHFIHYATAEAEGLVEKLNAFPKFRDELRPNLEAAPKFDTFALAHASWDVFPLPVAA
jgi:hypothetical protein